jgi:twitching motility protein PilT
MELRELLLLTVASGASDLHLSSGNKPIVRIDGDLQQLDQPELQHDKLSAMFQTLLSEEQYKIYEDQFEIDFAYALSDTARFRVNCYKHARGCGGAFRVIPNKVPSLADLGLPDTFKRMCEYRNGLVLVTGPTGSGKSTTLAAMIDYINSTTRNHIITVEDPIEFTHKSKNCLINQRELHRDTHSFKNALRSALREDPDVILVGEMRDLETIRLALTAAETGHLVFATLHTNSAAKTIDRVIDVFSSHEKSMIRTMISESLRAIVAQTLLKRKDGGRVAAHEILFTTPAIRNLIRENKIPQMISTIQTGQSQGMHTLEQHIDQLLASGIIGQEYHRYTENAVI